MFAAVGGRIVWQVAPDLAVELTHPNTPFRMGVDAPAMVSSEYTRDVTVAAVIGRRIASVVQATPALSFRVSLHREDSVWKRGVHGLQARV